MWMNQWFPYCLYFHFPLCDVFLCHGRHSVEPQETKGCMRTLTACNDISYTFVCIATPQPRSLAISCQLPRCHVGPVCMLPRGTWDTMRWHRHVLPSKSFPRARLCSALGSMRPLSKEWGATATCRLSCLFSSRRHEGREIVVTDQIKSTRQCQRQ